MTRKSIIIAILTLTFGMFAAANSFGQICLLGVGTGCTPTTTGTKNLYLKTGGAYFGQLTVNNSYFEIARIGGGDSIKAYKQSCKDSTYAGVKAAQCPFAYFNNQGAHIYTGIAYFTASGETAIIFTYDRMGPGGAWRTLNNQQWYEFR